MFSEDPVAQVVISVLVGIVLVVASISRLNRLDPREPPAAKSTVPLLGHIFGLLRNGTAYFQQLWWALARRLVNFPLSQLMYA